MSYRGQQHYARQYRGRVIADRRNPLFRDLQSVKINRYDPVRDVACAQCEVPYGEVHVQGEPDHVRSHEMHHFDKDATGFIERSVAASERRSRVVIGAS